MIRIKNRNSWTPLVNRLFNEEYDFFLQLLQLNALDERGLELALQNEFISLKSRMLKLMGLIYNRNIIQKAIDNLRFKDNHLKGNVLEMLENELSLKYSRKLTKVLEFNHMELFQAKEKSGSEMKYFMKWVLNASHIKVSEWTLAILIRCCKSKGDVFSEEELNVLETIKSDVIIQELNKK